MARNIKPAGSDTLSLYKTFSPLSKEVNLATASKKMLAEHGYPRKPGKKREPVLYNHWKRLLDKKLRYVKAKLRVDNVMSKRNPLKKDDSFRPISWGGIGLRTEDLGIPLGQPLCVFGEWVVPEIYPTEGQAPGPQTIGIWVGIDGWQGTQVLQAGMAATITGNSVDYWVWTEWYTEEYQDVAVKIENFEISPGDLISVLISAQTVDSGLITILNSTTNVITTVGIQGRSGMYLDGTSVQWIVEGVNDNLPNFFAWTFSKAFGASLLGGIFPLTPKGLTREIIGNGGYNLTESHIVSGTTGVVLWTGLA